MRANWVQDEVELLKLHYPNKTAKELEVIFPQYTNTQISRKAKQLKLTKKPEVRKQSRVQASLEAREDLWTDDEKKIIIEYYPTEGAKGVQERLPSFRPEDNIKKIAYRLGIKREQKDKIWELYDVLVNEEDSFSFTFKFKAK